MPDFKAKMFAWAKAYSPVAWLDSNDYPHQNHTYDAILALNTSRQAEFIHSPSELQSTIGKDWLFGYFRYEYAHAWEHISPSNSAHFLMPKLNFFCPEKLWILKGETLTAYYASEDCSKDDFVQIQQAIPTVLTSSAPIDLQPRISKIEYLQRATALKKHILRGDIYEVNFCMEWFSESAHIQPRIVFQKLNAISQTPFSAYLHVEDIHLMCASPERFLQRQGQKITSQPIKGTAARNSDNVLDKAVAQQLKQDPKERAENIMITDLVRNDISRIAQKGSVKVAEQCAVYSFAQVHQMISTVTAQCDTSTSSLDIIDACFPMGSMTGAPKQRAMELIDRYENCQRGLYSGAVGYIDPTGDFDFNVVIRSLIYDEKTHYLSTHVGSAITAASDVENEYEECQLKAEAIKKVLTNKLPILLHGTKV